MKIKLPNSTVVLQREDKFLFIVPDRPDWVVVNANTAKLLSLCDGTMSVDEILSYARYHMYYDSAKATIDKLITDGFFNTESDNIDTNVKKCVSKLYSLHLNMTSNCNLRCIYCYAEERTKNNENTLNLNQYFNLIDEIAEVSSNVTITFTGGEPLLNPYTLKVAKYCKQKKLNTFLLTNGTLINSTNVGDIIKYFDTIRISIDGATALTHNQCRGNGSYQKATEAIRLLEEKGKPPLIAMTVTSTNKHEIKQLSDQYGDRLTFQPLYNVGRAKCHKLGISGTEYYEALTSAPNVEPYGQLTKKLMTMRKKGVERCAIAEGEISISPSGEVFPCHMLHVDKFCAGTIKKQKFSDIYYTSEVLKYIRTLSVNSKPTCINCPIRLLCAGGCWARSYYANGDINEVDDFCDYELLAVTNGLFQHYNV